MTSIVGNLLLVATVVFLGAVLAIGSFAYLDGLGAPTATADFTYERTPAGLEMTPEALSTAVDVQLNGKHVATFSEDAAGRTVLLPTAPGDRITAVSRDGEQTVLVDKTVDDRSEVGDFIAYYTFDSTSGSDLVDRSGNGNDGTLSGSPTWTGNSLRFSGGGGDHVDVTNLAVPGKTVSEFTVAVAYRQDGSSGRVNQLVEHYNGGNEWFLENPGASGNQYRTEYAVNYPNDLVSSGTTYTTGQRHVAVGTFDGSTYELYVDGNRVGSDRYDSTVNMGDLVIGADAPNGNSQTLDGEIYEIRLYYTAFDGEEIRVISTAMG
ncbi:LamG domain-containing protein [Haloarcula sp. GH36]|uniref:LamG domain-containing protein n=1 Tax=Haloarcula montana TaxID=3111776 RepID=UPI002D774BA0|nr:LamG domain-containing protein [Haloarcula sp. GH36]